MNKLTPKRPGSSGNQRAAKPPKDRGVVLPCRASAELVDWLKSEAEATGEKPRAILEAALIRERAARQG